MGVRAARALFTIPHVLDIIFAEPSTCGGRLAKLECVRNLLWAPPSNNNGSKGSEQARPLTRLSTNPRWPMWEFSEKRNGAHQRGSQPCGASGHPAFAPPPLFFF